MPPQMHHDGFSVNHCWQGTNHTQPDSAQVSQVEDIMKFCWCRQHLRLGSEP